MNTIEQKLKDFREALLDKDYPLGMASCTILENKS